MFDQKRAYLLAQICQLSYEEYPTIPTKNIYETLGTGLDIYPMSVKDTQALGIANDKELIIAFRGTEPDCINDWLTDINIKRTDGIHRGFRKAYQDIRENIRIIVKDNIFKNIYITGHSLGGALATICTLNSLDLKMNLKGIYTFGAPRCFSKRKSRIYDALYGDISYRIVNNCDIVTRIPTRMSDYHHVAQLVYIDNDGKLHYGDSAYGFWKTFWDRVEGRLESLAHLRLADGIDDHAIAKYIKFLKP
ncbi:MAG: lipase family protein [bacterium]